MLKPKCKGDSNVDISWRVSRVVHPWMHYCGAMHEHSIVLAGWPVANGVIHYNDTSVHHYPLASQRSVSSSLHNLNASFIYTILRSWPSDGEKGSTLCGISLLLVVTDERQCVCPSCTFISHPGRHDFSDRCSEHLQDGKHAPTSYMRCARWISEAMRRVVWCHGGPIISV